MCELEDRTPRLTSPLLSCWTSTLIASILDLSEGRDGGRMTRDLDWLAVDQWVTRRAEDASGR